MGSLFFSAVLIVTLGVATAQTVAPCAFSAGKCKLQPAYMNSQLESALELTTRKKYLTTCFDAGTTGAFTKATTDGAVVSTALNSIIQKLSTEQTSQVSQGHFLCTGQSTVCSDLVLGDGVKLASGDSVLTVCGPKTFTPTLMKAMLQATVDGDAEAATQHFLTGSSIDANKVTKIVADACAVCEAASEADCSTAGDSVAATVATVLVDNGASVKTVPPSGLDVVSAAQGAVPALLAVLAAALLPVLV